MNNEHSPRKKLIDEILYQLIKTDIKGYPINIMLDSGWDSSHMISKVEEDNNIQTRYLHTLIHENYHRPTLSYRDLSKTKEKVIWVSRN